MMRVGVFSGTFDPFHIAHLEVCLVSRAACELDVVTVMIEKEPRRKSDVTAYKQRLAIVDLALQQHPSIRVIDPEVNSITANSALQILRHHFENAQFFYILGSDVVEYILQWPQLDTLTANFTFCVVLRDNKDEPVVRKQLSEIKKKFSNLNYRLLPAVWSPISSSKIREEVKTTGYSEYVHRDVLNYILKNRIY